MRTRYPLSAGLGERETADTPNGRQARPLTVNKSGYPAFFRSAGLI